MNVLRLLSFSVAIACSCVCARPVCTGAVCAGAAEPVAPDPAYYHEGDLAGSLKTAEPLPLYGADPQDLANRLFAAFYIRTSDIPTKTGGKPVHRIEGGD